LPDVIGDKGEEGGVESREEDGGGRRE